MSHPAYSEGVGKYIQKANTQLKDIHEEVKHFTCNWLRVRRN